MELGSVNQTAQNHLIDWPGRDAPLSSWRREIGERGGGGGGERTFRIFSHKIYLDQPVKKTTSSPLSRQF